MNKNREVESSDDIIFSEDEVFSTSRDTKSAESSELEKKNNIWEIMILLLTLVSYLMFFIVAISLINELIFPNYLGGDGILDLLIYLLFGVIARSLTLLRYELRQRFIIILKNIFAFILMTSILGFLSLKGFTIFIISLILTIYLDIKSPNSKLEWLKSGPFLKSPKKVIFVIAGFLFIYYSLRMGVYNMGIENSLSQPKLASGNQDSNNSRVDNEVSVSESKNLSNISDPRETLRQMQEKHDRYMSDPEDAKQTIKGIQKGLYELGYYKGCLLYTSPSPRD